MSETEMQELLALTRENNEMLREVVEYIRKIDSTEYRDAADMKDFSLNVAANALVEQMDSNRKQNIYRVIKSSGMKL